MAVGGVICCGRWAAGLAGCGVGRCWRWASSCCEVWQGVQAVQLVSCGVIGAALAVLLVSVCFWLAVRVGGVPAGSSTGPSLIRTDPAGDPVQRAGSRASGGKAAQKKRPGRRRVVRCCSGLWSALAAMVPAGCVPVPAVGLICWRWAWSALAPFPLSAFQRHGWRWRCSIRAGFGRLPEGSDSPPNGSEKQV